MNPAANTLPKAIRQLELAAEMCEQAEAEAVDEQMGLGEALRDLRIAAMVPRNAIAQRLGLDAMKLAGIEHRANSEIARRYRAAVVQLSETGGYDR